MLVIVVRIVVTLIVVVVVVLVVVTVIIDIAIARYECQIQSAPRGEGQALNWICV